MGFQIGIGVFFLVSRYWSFLRERPVVSGLIYGPRVYLFMNFVVTPLSAFPYAIQYPPIAFVEGFVSHALLVGLPIALGVRWADRRAAARPRPSQDAGAVDSGRFFTHWEGAPRA